MESTEEQQVASGAQGLDLSGFFDVTAQTDADRTFDIGSFEVDLEYRYGVHLGASGARVWDGDGAQVAVAFVDYHQFDDRIPPRGRIFEEPGFHLQAGRFDLPFGIDYQYFAAPDRPNVTAPLTTERVEQGGFNSDGARVYGTWSHYDYALYWVDSVVGDSGRAVGGRLGFFPARNPYRLHRFAGNRNLELGLSYVQDMDKDWGVRDRFYGVDATIGYGPLQLSAEWVVRDSLQDVIGADGLNLGRPNESAVAVSLLADLKEVLGRPLYVFGRYDRWDPDYDLVPGDGEEVTHRVGATPRLTLALGYDLSRFVRLKLEYSKVFGDGTDEPGFSDSQGIAQLTARF